MVSYTSVPSIDGPRSKRTVLQWLGPELAALGLIKNEQWLIDNTNQAVALYRNQSFHTVAVLIASWHPYALDYLKQAPVLALVVADGRPLVKIKERQQVCRMYRPLFSQGLKLRELMDKCKVAYGLRALHSHALVMNQHPTLVRLAILSPSVMAQAIPKTTRKQMQWLSMLGEFGARLRTTPLQLSLDARDRFIWMARHAAELTEVQYGADVGYWLANAATTLADFAFAQGSGFNLAWGAVRALAEAQNWHTRLAAMSAEETFFAQHGLAFDQDVDYGSFPDQWESHEGYVFHALRSGLSLFEEGRAMRHCVASYSRQIVERRARIYSIRKADKRVATVEFCKGSAAIMGPLAWGLVQFKGPCNAQPPAPVGRAITDFLKAWRDAE